MCSLKFRASTGIKGFNVFLTVDKKIPADVEDETKIEGVSKLRLLNKTAETLGDPYHKQVPLPSIPDYRA